MLRFQREQEAGGEAVDGVDARDVGVVVEVGLLQVSVLEGGEIPDDGKEQPGEEEGGGEDGKDGPPAQVNR